MLKVTTAEWTGFAEPIAHRREADAGDERDRVLLAADERKEHAMTTLENILDSKGHDLHVVAPSDTALHAVQVMCEARVGAVLVMDGPLLAGIFSERDLMRRVVLAGRDPMSCRVHEVMTSQATCAALDATVHDAMVLVTEQRIRHVPVVGEGGRVVGVVSIGDLVSSVAAERENELERLHDYVAGRYPG
jgi:CBS domain-containing protein